MRYLWALLLALLPARARRTLGRLTLGWDVHPTAYVGRSLILVDRLVLGPGASIGPFNVIRHLEELRLEEGASIGTRNMINGWPKGDPVYAHAKNRRSALVMGRYSLLTVAHELDCSDQVSIGDFASVAGFRSVILTHSLDLVRDRFTTGPVSIGHHTAVMSGCTLLSGTVVPARSILSAGSVVNTKLTDELTFYRGNPAEAVRPLPERLKFFHRATHPAAADRGLEA